MCATSYLTYPSCHKYATVSGFVQDYLSSGIERRDAARPALEDQAAIPTVAAERTHERDRKPRPEGLLAIGRQSERCGESKTSGPLGSSQLKGDPGPGRLANLGLCVEHYTAHDD